jgi:hypothetical protein
VVAGASSNLSIASIFRATSSWGVDCDAAALVAEIAYRNIPVVQTIAHRLWVYPATVAFPERLNDPRW